MIPRVNEFCCLASLRSGCIIIGLFMIITSTIYLFGYFTHKDTGDEKQLFYFREGTIISLIGCAFNYIISATLLIGVYLIFVLVLAAAVLLLLYSFFLLFAVGFAASREHYPSAASYLIFAVLHFYFALVAYSYYAEGREEKAFWESMEEARRAEFQEERRQAREQGLPDPFKAALMKYRKKSSLDDEERERRNRGSEQAATSEEQK